MEYLDFLNQTSIIKLFMRKRNNIITETLFRIYFIDLYFYLDLLNQNINFILCCTTYLNSFSTKGQIYLH